MLAHPNVSKFDLNKQLTVWRHQDPKKWNGAVTIQRPGLSRGRAAVRLFDGATLRTLMECRKEQQGKKFRHVNQDPNTERLYRSRRRRITLTVEDNSAIKVVNALTIRVPGVSLRLAHPIPDSADVRAIQVLERKSSLRGGRNRSLRARSYEIRLIVHVPDPAQKDPLDNPVGLDTGITHTLADSNGNFHDQLIMPRDRIRQLQSMALLKNRR